jgi:nucleoside-diphosphate-sugar epimerase
VVGDRARSLAQSLKKWRSDDVLSGEKSKRELGFKTETSLSEGIRKEIRWYRNNK